MSKTFGVLTSGGDSPGMNAAVVSVARFAEQYGIDLMGIRRGYNGLLGKNDNELNDIRKLRSETVLDILDLRGTYLRTARCEEFKLPEVLDRVADDLKHKYHIDGLVIIGGDGSYKGALDLCKRGIPCVGIPGTIDNDLPYTEATLGYDTAVNVCVEAVRSIRATSRSHDRPHVVEVMGRYCGDIAMRTAIATGAEFVIVPERKWDLRDVVKRLNSQIANGNSRATIIICEHAWENGNMADYPWQEVLCEHDKCVHEDTPFSSQNMARVLKYECGVEVRSTVIGYTQRGAIPTAYDSAFAFEAGRMAVDLLLHKTPEPDDGFAIGVRDGRVFHTSLRRAALKLDHRPFNEELYHTVNTLPYLPREDDLILVAARNVKK
ncbi:MAG TPA: ATP-dependent 6-phosphofructokinase [Candidatus Limiplasma sp.]|nr:ATP-dependent 6-phosphofructokinase [Candidatus Limiplasma sp.]HRX08862.1 ATP-dependent 6-phosphofructokinase [Candidatus Limiplasma sp.]